MAVTPHPLGGCWQMLPNEVQERLATEFRFAVDQMKATDDIPTKLYFYTVFFGEAQRMLNMAWDPNIALVHLVTREAYREINGRINEVTSGQDRVVGLFSAIPIELEKASDELASIFEAKPIDYDSLLKVLSRMAELAYLSTGNGKYIALKGLADI